MGPVIIRYIYGSWFKPSKASKYYLSSFLLTKITGDEVVEWNGRSLHGKSVQDVYEIISETRQEPQVELIVSRLIAANRKAAQASWRQSHSPTRLNQKGIKA